MWGAIVGDVVGSVHEFAVPPTKKVDFGPLLRSGCEFTDDTILTVATAKAVLDWIRSVDEKEGDRDLCEGTGPGYGEAHREWGRRYPSSYGARFSGWLWSEAAEPYNSFGNGSAMRVSPVGWAFESLEETLKHAELSALPSHNHPEGIKGAQAVAHAIYMARNGWGKNEIRDRIESDYGYDLRRSIDEIRPGYSFDETCQGTVPEAMIAFLESDDYESAVRLAISLGGDADTLACITGSIAEAFYGPVPDEILRPVRGLLPWEMVEVVDGCVGRFGLPK